MHEFFRTQSNAKIIKVDGNLADDDFTSLKTISNTRIEEILAYSKTEHVEKVFEVVDRNKILELVTLEPDESIQEKSRDYPSKTANL